MALFQDISIHGVPQIFDKTTSVFKRCCFVLILLISFGGSAFFIFETIRHYHSNPVYMKSDIVRESEEYPLEWPDLVIRLSLLKRKFDDILQSSSERSSVYSLFEQIYSEFQNESVSIRTSHRVSRTGKWSENLASDDQDHAQSVVWSWEQERNK